LLSTLLLGTGDLCVARPADCPAVAWVVDVCGVPPGAGGVGVGDDVVGFVGVAGAARQAELAFAVSSEDGSADAAWEAVAGA